MKKNTLIVIICAFNAGINVGGTVMSNDSMARFFHLSIVIINLAMAYLFGNLPIDFWSGGE